MGILLSEQEWEDVICKAISEDYTYYEVPKRIPRKVKKKIRTNSSFVLLWDWDLNKCIWHKIIK